MRLRNELLRFERADGGLDVLDLLLERLHHFTPAEAAQLARLPEGAIERPLRDKLEAATLLDGPEAEAMRRQAWGSRTHCRAEPVAFTPAAGTWELARELPDLVAPRWHDPEAWRRLAEDRIAGRVLTRVEGFLPAEVAERYYRLAVELPFQRLDTAVVSADWAQPKARIPEYYALFLQGPLPVLIGAVLGFELPDRIHINTWRMAPGDNMAVHPNGVDYVATFCLGLNPGWTASHGGAITFGAPTADGFVPGERWLPQLGDLAFFAPAAMSWHVVEPVVRGVRHTTTGWYISNKDTSYATTMADIQPLLDGGVSR